MLANTTLLNAAVFDASVTAAPTGQHVVDQCAEVFVVAVLTQQSEGISKFRGTAPGPRTPRTNTAIGRVLCALALLACVEVLRLAIPTARLPRVTAVRGQLR
ncbi:MAG: hypothetical protein LC749_20105 [Actinobacteria bacterium]|nr:hypothetical protein [Actinomycetota bacterium]